MREPAWRALYPFESRYVTIDGHPYHYVEQGSGPRVVVCVHGNPTWSFYYRRLLTDLPSGYRVLAVDHLGCGLSAKPSDYRYRLEDHTANLVAWLDQLELEQVMLVVHDWGGAIGLGAAVQRPERVGRLVVLNTAAFPPPYVPWRIAACRLPLIGSWAIRYANVFALAATRMALSRLPRLDPAVKAGLLAPYGSPAERIGIDHFVRDIPLSRRHPTYRTLERLEGELERLAALPCQLVWGMRDWCFRPNCLERFERLWPRCVVQRLSDVGHYVMEEAPQEVLAAVQAGWEAEG
jgi:pimeloyl-ACP methyl ester carboxylesterase